jgi:hypothetical protein
MGDRRGKRTIDIDSSNIYELKQIREKMFLSLISLLCLFCIFFSPENKCINKSTIVVPDRRRRIVPEVVVVGCWAVGVLGIWRGEGLGKGWNKGGQFTSNLRPRWTDPVTARRVPSK